MKRIFTICISACIMLISQFQSQAAVILIEVEDFEFDPNIFTVNPGDEIKFYWDEGVHTTTSTVIPPGAAAWDQVIDQNNQFFSYFPTVPGSYDFICTYHQSMGMLGHFTVNNSTGISSDLIKPAFLINAIAVNDGMLQISYSLPSNGVKLTLTDISGKQAKLLESVVKASGTYDEKYYIADFRKGIYLVSLENKDARLVRRILIN